jgi:hypothetical protein
VAPEVPVHVASGAVGRAVSSGLHRILVAPPARTSPSIVGSPDCIAQTPRRDRHAHVRPVGASAAQSYGAAMRAPDIFEVVIAVGAAVTVIGAIIAILYRVTRGNADAERIEKLKAELASSKKPD